MTSISSRIIPASALLGLIRSFARDFQISSSPIHEVDAHVLHGQIYPLVKAARHVDPDIAAAGRAAIAKQHQGRSWVMVCHDSMSGPRPVVTATINLQMEISERGVHLMQSISSIVRIGPSRKLPYSLERVLRRNVTDSFWAPIDHPVERDAALLPVPQSKCA